MKVLQLALALAVLMSPTLTGAQSTKSKVVASNGISVDLDRDEFAGRSEYSTDFVDIVGERISYGKVFVGKIVRNSAPGKLSIQGYVGYGGEWAFFESAILKGGESVEFTSFDRKVESCRYGCTYSESFGIFPKAAQIAKYTSDGSLTIQVRGKAGRTFLITIPASYFSAMNEVAK